MSSEDETDKGICILSFDSGGPGSYSQLLLLKEYMSRLATDLGVGEDSLYPADYFNLIGGVGFGGIAALMLGHLRMTVDQTTDSLLEVASAVFPYDSNENSTPETNVQNLQHAIKGILEVNEIPVETRMCDKASPQRNCKVVIYAATSDNVTRPRPFRTYSTRGSSLNPTIFDALCAIMAVPAFFSSVKFGARGREQNFIGAPFGMNNPTRELLREAGIVFGNDRRVAQIISLGAELPNAELLDSKDPVEITGELFRTSNCETVAAELSRRLINVDAYIRLNVPSGIESSAVDDWRELAAIERQTSAYLETMVVERTIEQSLQYLKSRIGTATLGQINYSSNIKVSVKMAPAVSSHHVVRQKEWRILLHHLVDSAHSGQRIFCITGMAGCGKTQLVSYFLQEKGSQYTQSVFVDASSAATLKADLQAWAQSFGTGHEDDVWEDALRILASGTYVWVLILDNADKPMMDLSPFIPNCYSGTVVITSRNRNVGDLSNTHHLELGEISNDEAISTLLKASRRQVPLSDEEMDSVHALVGMLGKLAVAIVQAGTYCHQLSSATQGNARPFTFTQYVVLFSHKRAELMKTAELLSLDSYQLAEHGFRDAFILSQRPGDHKDAVANLKMLLCTNGDWSEIHVLEMVRTLRSFSLIIASSVLNAVFLHLNPLVHAWARDMLPSGSQKYQKLAMQILTSSVGDPNNKIYRYILPHIRVLHDGVEGDGPHINDQYAAGLVFKDQGYYKDAERFFMRILRTPRASGWRKDAHLSAVAMLAMTYRAQGKWAKAEKLGKELLEQWKTLAGEGNPDVEAAIESTASTIDAMVNLAATYTSQDRHSEAETLKLEAMRLQTQLTGPTHPETMITMANLAVTYSAQGRHKEAERLELKVLEGRLKLLGKDNPDSIHAALNLAITYREQGKLKQAEELLSRILEQAKKVMGEDHPTTVNLAKSLAATYGLQNRDTESAELELEVVQRLRKMLGKDHPDTVTAVANLALSYYKQLDLKNALPLLMEVVPATLRIWGKQHAYSLDRVEALAFMFEMLGQYEKARRVEELLQ